MLQQCQYVFPPFRLDPLDATLWRDEERVPLPAKNFALLSYLVAHAGRLVAHDEILDAVWTHRFVSPSVLKGAVARLRAALADDAKHCRFIQTVNQRGYRFVANVDVCWRGESWPGPKTGGTGAGRSTLVEMLQRHLELAGTRASSGRCAAQFEPERGAQPIICADEDTRRARGGDATLTDLGKHLLNAVTSNRVVSTHPDSGRGSIGIPAPWAALSLGDWCALIEALCRE